MSKKILLCVSVIIVMFLSAFSFAQNPGMSQNPPQGVGPGSNASEVPEAPGLPGFSNLPQSAVPSGPVPSGDSQDPFGEVYFSAGTVSPDGKALYVVFDRFLMKYTLPGLNLSQKVDVGLTVAPVTPSISMSPDGKWIYVIQNGVIVQIERESLKVGKTQTVKP